MKAHSTLRYAFSLILIVLVISGFFGNGWRPDSVATGQETSGEQVTPAESSPANSGEGNGGEGIVDEKEADWITKVDAWFGKYLVAPMAMVLFQDFGTPHWLGTSVPFVVVWLFVGALFFTLFFGFINIRGFWHAIRLTKGDYDNPDDVGEVTHFQALSSALSGTVGLGNIAGVAIAVAQGGPGATFWMILVGLLGMTSKFTECTLGQMYRRVDENGRVSGGPMRYLKDGLGEMKLGWLGSILSFMFIVLCIGGAFGGGNTFQISQSLDAIRSEVPILNTYPWIYGLCMCGAIGLVIVGGIKSIGKVASRIVPFMCAGYVACALFILFNNASEIPDAFSRIFNEAFNFKAGMGAFLDCMVIGIKRAVFSNEAGTGSASIAHSAAKTDIPVREGYVALLEPFIDTVVVCTMTALVIIITGVVDKPEDKMSLTTIQQELRMRNVTEVDGLDQDSAIARLLQEDSSLDRNEDGTLTVADYIAMDRGAFFTKEAFVKGGYGWFKWFLYIAVILFAYSTCISWYYYGERCFTALLGDWSSGIFKVLFLGFTFLGSIVATTNIKDFSDMLILGMAFPNMLGMYFLSGKVKRAFERIR